MINFADSNLARISYEREATFDTKNPTLNAQIARILNSTLAATKETVISDEMRSDRMPGGLLETAMNSGGDLGFELSLGGTWDDFLESLIAGTWKTPIAQAGVSITVTAATQTIALIGAFGATVPGEMILISGAANAGNNGWHRVVTVPDADSVTVSTPDTVLVDETIASGNLHSSTLRNPGDAANIVKRSYNLEQYFTDIDVAQLFTGQRLGTMSLTVAANAIVNGSWTFMGATAVAQEALGDYADSVVAPTDTDVVSSTANVGRIYVAGTQVPCKIQSIDLNIDNALRYQNAVGNKFPCGIGYGRQTITGTMELYFTDLTTYNLFLNHQSASLEFGFTDLAGNGLHFYLPQIKFGSSSPMPDGVDTDVMESIEFTAEPFKPAVEDAYQIQITAANPA